MLAPTTSSALARRAAEAVFPGSGEMPRLCREMDWATTPLGPVGDWPQSLRTAAGMVIAQGIAQNLCWGPEFLRVYNDAYREVMGAKHPAGLGRSGLWSWAEIRHEVEPLLARVMAGETVYFEDLHLRIERGGAPEDAYFTFSYSPVRVESGAIGGVLIHCFETTRQVHTRVLQAERDHLFSELRVERARLGYVFQHAPAFLAVLRVPEHTVELANDAYYQLVGHRELVGKRVADALPEIRDQGFLVTNAIKYTTEGGGRVSLTCTALEDVRGARWVDVAVQDDGRGIPADKLEAIFDPFVQVGRTLSRPEAGVGLGLAISRDLARGMGGDLRVASVFGEGSTFTLRLPAVPA